MLMWLNNTINSTCATSGECIGNVTTPDPMPDQETPQLAHFRFISEVVISIPIAVLGIIANVVSFVVLCHQKHRLTTTVMLQTLAVADTLILLCSLLVRSLIVVQTELHLLGRFHDVYPYIFICLYPVVYFLRLADTWLTTLLTIDRYIAVCHPLRAQRICTLVRTYKNMAVVVALALVFSIPRFFEYHLADNRYGFDKTDLLKKYVYIIVYRICLFFVFMYLIPVATLVYLNSRLLWELRMSDRFRAVLRQASGATGRLKKQPAPASRKSVTVIVVTVVLVCIVCNVTALISHLFWSLHVCFQSFRYLETARRYMSHISNIMININSAVNFFIYCLCSRNFRAELRRVFGCRRMRRQTPSVSTGRSPTGTIVSQISLCRKCGNRNSNCSVQEAVCRRCTYKSKDGAASEAETTQMPLKEKRWRFSVGSNDRIAENKYKLTRFS